MSPSDNDTPKSIKDVINNPADSSELSSNPKEDNSPRSSDYLSILHKEFYTSPALNLLKSYLIATNGSRKTEQNCMQAFREKHIKTFACLFLFDFILRIIYLTTLFFIVLRGLGILDYIIKK